MVYIKNRRENAAGFVTYGLIPLEDFFILSLLNPSSRTFLVELPVLVDVPPPAVLVVFFPVLSLFIAEFWIEPTLANVPSRVVYVLVR